MIEMPVLRTGVAVRALEESASIDGGGDQRKHGKECSREIHLEYNQRTELENSRC